MSCCCCPYTSAFHGCGCSPSIQPFALCPPLLTPPAAVSGLRLVLLDESGAPAPQEMQGRITLSWRGGHKKVTWNAAGPTATSAMKLAPVKVQIVLWVGGNGGE